MCKYAFRKLPFLIRYIPKTKQMCDKAILENGETLESVPYCCKNQEMCNQLIITLMH